MKSTILNCIILAVLVLNWIPQAAVAFSVRQIPTPIYGVTLDRVDNAYITGEIDSLNKLNKFPTARICFDLGESPSYYARQIPKLYSSTYIMGQILDSSSMARVNVKGYQRRSQRYVKALQSMVDVWEIGNEVNGGWLGKNTQAKIQVAYDAVEAINGVTALTFFYEGEPNGPNCLSSPANDMFTWIGAMFQLHLSPSQRNSETEKIRLGLNYTLISWYPDQCPGVDPDWATVYSKLAGIFPNSKVGFGELGTANPQGGSTYESNLINRYYPTAWTSVLPSSYIGGYFWWYFAEEMVPSSKPLFNVLNNAIA